MEVGERIPESIEHLDFEPEKKQNESHFSDPCNTKLTWCGKASRKRAFKDEDNLNTRDVRDINCVDCLQLYIRLGPDWWWTTHNAFFRSTCSPRPTIRHNCGA